MFKGLISFVSVSLAIVAPAYAECVDVIKSAALKGTVIQGQSAIDQQARNFCSEYASYKSSGKAISGGASYGGFGLSAASSQSEIDQVASKYCDAQNSYSARNSSYEQYVESIAPGAFESYNKCVAVTGDWINASLDPLAVHAKDLAITISNQTLGHGQEEVQFIASPGFTCTWHNGVGTTQRDGRVVLGPNTTTGLQCNRGNEAQEGSVTLITASRPNANYTFLWKKFQNGLPVDELQAIRKSNTALLESMKTAIVAFDSARCPDGWTAMPATAGRTIVGAGTGPGLTPRTNGDQGGEETHTLTIAEMPSHTHDGNVSLGGHSYEHHQYNNRLPGEQWQSHSKETGGGQAHNNMQPFVVMQYCKRTT